MQMETIFKANVVSVTICVIGNGEKNVCCIMELTITTSCPMLIFLVTSSLTTWIDDGKVLCNVCGSELVAFLRATTLSILQP